jgi:hypothetical protein
VTIDLYKNHSTWVKPFQAKLQNQSNSHLMASKKMYYSNTFCITGQVTKMHQRSSAFNEWLTRPLDLDPISTSVPSMLWDISSSLNNELLWLNALFDAWSDNSSNLSSKTVLDSRNSSNSRSWDRSYGERESSKCQREIDYENVNHKIMSMTLLFLRFSWMKIKCKF